MESKNAPELKRIRKWLDQHADALLDDPSNGIIGVGLGKKSAGPLDDDSPFSVTGFVEQKLTTKEIKAAGVTSFDASFALASGGAAPEDLGMEIDLVATGSKFAANVPFKIPMAQRGAYGGKPPVLDLQKRFDVLRAGVGITNPVGTYPNYLSVGTLGFFVEDSQGALYLVSNNHVIAEENSATAGDAIVQPGTLDLTQSELNLMSTKSKLLKQLKVAELRAWIDLQFHSAAGIPHNEVDCAIAEVDASLRDATEASRVGLGGVLHGVAKPLVVDDVTGAISGSTRVFKAGRTTGWTEGSITAVSVVTDVSYGVGTARFRNQLGISATADNSGPFSDRGDSGSGILNSEHKLVGLLFAGSTTRTLANPIHLVLTRLETALNRGKLKVVSG
jgi:hypothetical protein